MATWLRLENLFESETRIPDHSLNAKTRPTSVTRSTRQHTQGIPGWAHRCRKTRSVSPAAPVALSQPGGAHGQIDNHSQFHHCISETNLKIIKTNGGIQMSVQHLTEHNFYQQFLKKMKDDTIWKSLDFEHGTEEYNWETDSAELALADFLKELDGFRCSWTFVWDMSTCKKVQ